MRVVMAMKDSGARGPALTIGRIDVWNLVAQRLRDAGMDFLRLEEAEELAPGQTVALWDFGSYARLPRALKRAAEGRVVAWCLESPLVADRAYRRLPRIAEEAAHVVTFPGAQGLLPQHRAEFHPVLWPSCPTPPAEEPRWNDRDFLTMVNSNKEARPVLAAIDTRDPYVTLRRITASTLSAIRATTGAWRVPDLYRERIAALRHFARSKDFSLYGVGWDRRIPGVGRRDARAILRSSRGPVKDKADVLRRHRFVLAIENTSFPGYISEKLLDCLFAGSIPVYLGAPDISQYIPREVFVDLRQFSSYGAVEKYLRSMTRQESDERLLAAREFIHSEDFRLFEADYFADVVTNAVRACCERPR